MSQKPSKRFCKHGYLAPGERYHPDLHNAWANNIRERCGDFYTEDEIRQMESEIKPAVCPICLEEIEDGSNCLSCHNGHKFHNFCSSEHGTNSRITSCPVCRDRSIRPCKNVNDIFSGGKRKRRTRRNRKHSKKTYRRKRSHSTL